MTTTQSYPWPDDEPAHAADGLPGYHRAPDFHAEPQNVQWQAKETGETANEKAQTGARHHRTHRGTSFLSQNRKSY